MQGRNIVVWTRRGLTRVKMREAIALLRVDRDIGRVNFESDQHQLLIRRRALLRLEYLGHCLSIPIVRAPWNENIGVGSLIYLDRCE